MNILSTGVWEDGGGWSNAMQNGTAIPSLDPLTRGRLLIIPMIQRGGSFSPLAIGSTKVYAAVTHYLYEETTPQDAGGGLLTWNRYYAAVPPDRIECETFVYNQQVSVSAYPPDPPTVADIPCPTTSTIQFHYQYTADPLSIALRNSRKMGVVPAGETNIIYTVGDLFAEGRILAEDESLSRYKGDIWEKRTRTIAPGALLF